MAHGSAHLCVPSIRTPVPVERLPMDSGLGCPTYLLGCNGRVAWLTEPAQVAPDQPQVRPLRDRDDVVDFPRCHDQPAFQAQTAEWFLSQNHAA